MIEETTITIRHVDTKLDEQVQLMSDKDTKSSKNWYYVVLLELGLKAYKKGYRYEDNIPTKGKGE